MKIFLIYLVLEVYRSNAITFEQEEDEGYILKLYQYYLNFASNSVIRSQERYQVFKENYLSVIDNNSEGNRSWVKALNQFSMFFKEELEEVWLMVPQDCPSVTDFNAYKSFDFPLPDSWDWRQQNVVTPPKNQESCGSSWAFSATGALESHWAIYTHKQPAQNLSAQQLVDCANGFLNFGCLGGLPSQAFEYIHYNGGIDTQDSYPYTAEEEPCFYNKSTVGAKDFQGSVNLTAGDENSIMNSLVLRGPISVVFNVETDFFSYSSGVYSSKACSNSTSMMNHAALLVGYGHDDNSNLDYWIAKNSWGINWGIEGYFWIERGNNMCGIANCASFPALLDI